MCIQMLAVLCRKSTLNGGTIPTATHHSPPRIFLPIPSSKAWLFLRPKQKAQVQEEKENASKPGGRFTYAWTYMVPFSTMWQDWWWSLKPEPQGWCLRCWSAVRKEQRQWNFQRNPWLFTFFSLWLPAALEDKILKPKPKVLHQLSRCSTCRGELNSAPRLSGVSVHPRIFVHQN